MSVRDASSALNSISASRPSSSRPWRTQRTASASAVLAIDPQLVLEVDVARGDEHVEVRPVGDLDRLDRPLRVAVAAAREGRDRDVLRRLLGDPPDRLEVARRGGREAGLDDVDLEARQLAGDLELLGGGQAGARRLLPVAQGRVEDADACPAATNGPSGRGTPARSPGRSRGRGRGLGLAGLDLDRVEERHLGTEPRPDLLDLVVAVGRAQSLELVAAGVVLLDPAVGERAVLDVAEDGAHPLADALVDEPRAAARSRRTRPCR